MPSLPNYLKTNRKRSSLTQEEAAFLLGITGIDRANKVLRDEKCDRMPSLRAALAYELIYGKPVAELFAGLREGVAREIAARARALRHRKGVSADPGKAKAVGELVNRCSLSAKKSKPQ